MFRKFMLPVYKQKRLHRLLRLGAADLIEAAAAVDGVVLRLSGGVTASSRLAEQRSVRSLLATLDADCLKVLCDVLESRGAVLGACVLVCRQNSSDSVPVRTKPNRDALLLMCKYFRWPSLLPGERLQRLPACSAQDDDEALCVNPHHWSRVYAPVADISSASLSDTKPPHPLRDHQQFVDGLLTCHSASSSVATGGTHQYGSITSVDGCGYNTWCRVFYYERRCRIGPLGGWSVRAPHQHIFHELPGASGLSLGASAVSPGAMADPSDTADRAKHIGAGLTVWLADSGVWLYNRSERPLFVTSALLQRRSAGVHRLQPGHATLVHDGTPPPLSADVATSIAADATAACVTVSFAKGWGPCYRRSTVLECPCWLELWLCGPALLNGR